MGRLRHPVGLDYRDAEAIFERRHNVQRQGRRRGTNQPKGVARDLCDAAAIHLGKKRLVNRRHGRVPRRMVALQPIEELRAVVAWGTYDAPPETREERRPATSP